MKLTYLRFLFFLLSSLTSTISAQTIKKFDQKNTEKITQRVNELVNQYRKDTLQLQTFSIDDKLYKASINQLEYCLKTGKSIHTQESKKNSTLRKRIKQQGGLHFHIQEIVWKFSFDRTLKVYRTSKRIKTNTIESISQYMFQTLLSHPSNFKAITDYRYTRLGLSVGYSDKTNKIQFVFVLGSQPFDFEEDTMDQEAYGIELFHQDECYECKCSAALKTDTLPTYVQEGTFVKKGIVYYYFSDLTLFQKIYDKDYSISADIIFKEQFPCGTANILYPSTLHSGYLIPPVKISDILLSNTTKEEQKILAPIATLPSKLSTLEAEANMLLIHKKKLCRYYTFSPVYGATISNLAPTFYKDSVSPTHIIPSKFKQNKFIIPFQKNKSEYQLSDIQPIYDSLNLKNHIVRKVQIIAYSSVEGNTKHNHQLQQQRASSILQAFQSLQADSIIKDIRTFENWKQFRTDIAQTTHSSLLKKSKKEVKELLNNTPLEQELEPILAQERKAIITLFIEKKPITSSHADSLFLLLKKSIKKQNNDQTTSYFTQLYQQFQDSSTQVKLAQITIPYQKEFTSIIQLQLITLYQYGLSLPSNDSLYTLFNLCPSRSPEKTNIAFLILEKWYEKSLFTPSQFSIEDINALVTSSIYRKKLLLNYHLIAAEYYQKNFQEEKCIPHIDYVLNNYQFSIDSEIDALQLANYLVYYDYIEDAREILQPYAIEPSAHEDVIFYYLSLSIPYNIKKSSSTFKELMKRAKKINTHRFCKLFGQSTVTFQLFQNYFMKSMYCESCELEKK